MNEEKNTVTPQEQEPREEKLPKAKRTALVRYIAILFVFAFLVVLGSLYLQYRNTATKQISDLTSEKTSALARAEQLQNENLELQQTVAKLEEDADTAQKEHEQDLLEQQKVYDALVRLLSKPDKIGDPKFVEAVKTVTEGKEKLSQTAWEAYAAYAEEIGITKTEETKP